MSLHCHSCKEELSQWEAFRTDTLTNSDRIVLFHFDCYEKINETKRAEALNRFRLNNINVLGQEVKKSC
jgi:hypothetical protein